MANIYKWVFKTTCAILILSNTFNIVMAVFDVSQSVIASAAGIVTGATNITPDMLADLEMTLETMELGSLLGLFLQSFLIKFTMLALNIFIFVIVYGRMIEIYLLTSLAPSPWRRSPTGNLARWAKIICAPCLPWAFRVC